MALQSDTCASAGFVPASAVYLFNLSARSWLTGAAADELRLAVDGCIGDESGLKSPRHLCPSRGAKRT